jgi:Flp pilus assembly pilin Flp
MNALHRVRQHLRSLADAETGSAAIEYAVLIGLIAVALVSVVSGLAGAFTALSGYMADELARAIATYAS